MKIIEPFYKIEAFPDESSLEKLIERAGRVCWKSEDAITEDSAAPFIGRILKSGHESVIEHQSATVMFTADRGFTHELVRHRLCSFSQSSTRYANYSKGKFGSEITVIRPYFFEDEARYTSWERACLACETEYMNLVSLGAKPEEARSVLPNSLMTEIYMTANMREWRHVFKLRCHNGAHPQMRQLMRPLLADFARKVPVLFADIDGQYNNGVVQ